MIAVNNLHRWPTGCQKPLHLSYTQIAGFANRIGLSIDPE
jgi:hypothetical protein